MEKSVSDEAIQGLWVKGALPPMQELSIRSFLAHGHRYDLYSYDEIPNLPFGARLLPGNLILPEVSIFSMRLGVPHAGSVSPFSNLFRYKLLLERGGWWADLDVVCLRRFDFTSQWIFASERREEGGLLTATCVIKGAPGSELLRECYERARSHEELDTVWASTGPHLLHSLVEQHGLTEFMVQPDTFCPIDWWRAVELLEPGKIPPHSYAVHLWNEMWRQAGWSKEPIYRREVLYQRLCRQYLGGH